jgi:hypothetical protein
MIYVSPPLGAVGWMSQIQILRVRGTGLSVAMMKFTPESSLNIFYLYLLGQDLLYRLRLLSHLCIQPVYQ